MFQYSELTNGFLPHAQVNGFGSRFFEDTRPLKTAVWFHFEYFFFEYETGEHSVWYMQPCSLNRTETFPVKVKKRTSLFLNACVDLYSL